MLKPRPLVRSFSNFSSNCNKTLGFCNIRTYTVRVKDQYTDHKTTNAPTNESNESRISKNQLTSKLDKRYTMVLKQLDHRSLNDEQHTKMCDKVK